MCGRFVLEHTPAQLQQAYRLPALPDWSPRYNMAPRQQVAVVRQHNGGARELVRLQWGLIPAWSRDPASGDTLINARSETVHEKPSFRQALQARRCIVPASGFYEWEHAGKFKIPHYIHLRDGALLSLAGLWERWKSPEGPVIETCTILTTTANSLIRPLHERMPVILHPDEVDLWLDRSVDSHERLRELFHPYPGDQLAEHRVATDVNSPGTDHPGCILAA